MFHMNYNQYNRDDVLLTTPVDRLKPAPAVNTYLPTPQITRRHSQQPWLWFPQRSGRVCLSQNARDRWWSEHRARPAPCGAAGWSLSPAAEIPGLEGGD